MLRITRLSADDEVTLKLEGKFLAPWIDEVRRACAEAAGGSRAVRLNLAGVTFVDSACIDFLRGLADRGVWITEPSSFVSELLRMEARP